MDKNKLIKISIIATDVLLFILLASTVSLPFAVSWYVEKKGRSKILAATIFVTCYPCVPFAAISMLSLRKLLKLTKEGKLFSPDSQKPLRKIAICSIIMSVITLVAGKFYLPFLIMGAALLFLSLIVFAFRAVIAYETENKNDP